MRDDPRLGDRLPIRLGVASGEVVARRDAAAGQDFLITGDAVNVAARLQQDADAWAILVAERDRDVGRGLPVRAGRGTRREGQVRRGAGADPARVGRTWPAAACR